MRSLMSHGKLTVLIIVLFLASLFGLASCQVENPDADSAEVEERSLPTGVAGSIINDMAVNLSSQGYSRDQVVHMVDGASANVFNEKLSTSNDVVSVAPIVQKGAQTSLRDTGSGITSSAARLEAVKKILAAVIASLNGRISNTAGLNPSKQTSSERVVLSLTDFKSVFEALSSIAVASLEESGLSASDMDVSVAAVAQTIAKNLMSSGLNSSNAGDVSESITKGVISAIDDAGISGSFINTTAKNVTAKIITGLKEGGMSNAEVAAVADDITEGAVLALGDAGVSNDDVVTSVNEIKAGITQGLSDAGLSAAEITVVEDSITVAAETATSTLTDGAVTLPGFTVSSISGEISEAGTSATFNVKLNTEPSSDVTIPISSSDTGEGTVNPASLTLTPTNWNAADNTVTVTGQSDTEADGDQTFYIILGDASSDDPAYNGLNPIDVAVTNIDAASTPENAGFIVSDISGDTGEDETTATFTVRLKSQPSSDVTISVISANTSEGVVSSSTLTFTPLNWSSNQTVTVTGVNDFQVDGNQTYFITLGSASSSDPNYSGKTPPNVTVINTDDDSPGFIVNVDETETNEDNTDVVTIDVKLRSQPSTTVTVRVTVGDTSEGTAYIGYPPTLGSGDTITFTTSDWDQNHGVTIMGKDDDYDDGDQQYWVTLEAASSADSNYDGLNPTDVLITNVDYDTAGFNISVNNHGPTSEDGDYASFYARLTTKPTADVTMVLTLSDTSEAYFEDAPSADSPLLITWTPTDWDTQKNARVTGRDDNIVDGDVSYSVLRDVSSDDATYDALSISDWTLTNTDDDYAALDVDYVRDRVTPEDGSSSFSFNVLLTSEPISPVTVDVTCDDPSEALPTPTTLTFDHTNWNTNRSVTVTGQDDSIADGDQTYSIIVSIVSSGSDYESASDVTLPEPSSSYSFTTTDDDWRYPDTNQSDCYNDSISITCPSSGEDYYGQDAQYSSNSPSYTDNGDGTITDNRTGLVWQQTVGTTTDNWNNAKSYCTNNTAGLPGSGWRLPSSLELFGLFYFGSSAPYVNSTYFSGVDSAAFYWSSSEWDPLNNSDEYFGVIFDSNLTRDWKDYSEPHRVWCVRGYETSRSFGDNSFVDNNNGTITDTLTGFMWQKSEGETVTWKQALNNCENLIIDSYSDWRLPSIKEMLSIAVNYRDYPAFDTNYFSYADNWDIYYWTSTTSLNRSDYALMGSFNKGTATEAPKTASLAMYRCVRGGL